MVLKIVLNYANSIKLQYFECLRRRRLFSLPDALSEHPEERGKDAQVVTNKSGDKIFMSKDGLRKICFDINNSHGDIPHIHLQEFENGKWIDAISGTHRIYPK